MTHILKNKDLEIHVDLPLENYNFSRFDWTGKIVAVKFKNICITGAEKTDNTPINSIGKGLYNEFGIDRPLGYELTKKGAWFHKIGVGLLKKEDSQYFFHKEHQIKPADFHTTTASNKISINCTSDTLNGYSYILKKEIILFESYFTMQYHLHNTGEKTIKTNEYNHNFLAIDNDPMGSNYILKFPFQLNPQQFTENVNPERKITLDLKEIKLNGCPNEQFFFSDLSGGKQVTAGWELINLKHKIGIRETGNFPTNKINVWGWNHVISPELFFNICLEPNQSVAWSRTYHLFKI